jgi:NarL family two-component system response regulator LiaR
MAEGMDNKRIAETLIVSNSTVKFHVSNILAKLHKENRTEAVVTAYQHHLIQSDFIREVDSANEAIPVVMEKY